MNKSLYWKKNKLISTFAKLQKKYKYKVEKVSGMNANACVIKYDNEYLILINNTTPNSIMPLVVLHEIGHIKFRTLNEKPQKYSYFKETSANLYAVSKLLHIFKFKQKIKILYLTITSEKELYKYFKKNNTVKGDFLYEQFTKNE